MDYGVKISQNDADVIGKIKNQPDVVSPENKAHILLTLAIPYLNGAYTQVERYEAAASQFTPRNAVNVVNTCLHEASSLFEDICTVSKYMTDLCGYKNDNHQLWIDIRNHIRHDVRENFDTTNKRDAERRENRLKRLGVSDKLQTSIGFEKDSMSIGATVVTMGAIKDYLLWASEIIADIVQKAEADGKIKRS